jgi:hypothetical protein
MTHLQRLFALTLFSLTGTVLMAQEKRLVSGIVSDALTHEALPFTTVALKKQLIGTVTNDEGKFDFYVPVEFEADTLVIGYFGYTPQYIALSAISGPLVIKLEPNAVELQEVVIRVLKPEGYIRMAMQRINENYPKLPFGTDAYYREKVIENKNLIKCDEGIFRTYYTNYLDTVRNPSQLMLFRRAQNTSKVEFMSKEREKKAEKEKKKGKKDDENIGVDVSSSFGGPENILKSAALNRHTEGCIDTLKFKSYNYSFAKSTTYNNSELIVIDFSTKGKVDHIRAAGRIYLDVASLAIVKIESKGDFIIPVIIKPILFLYGLGIENPSYEKNLEFQQVKGKWYPKNIQFNINVELVNRHWFKKNEHSLFEIEGAFIVNKTNVDNALQIPMAKRFNSKKDMKDQVFNDENISWEGLNIIKK